MSIEEYIVDRWWLKVSDHRPILTIYDEDGMYHALLTLAEKKGFTVFDTTDRKLDCFLRARECWSTMMQARKGECRMLIYRNIKAPVTEREVQADPYYAISLAGEKFPDGPNDYYYHICQRYLPQDRHAEFERVWKAGRRDFAIIDSLVDGNRFPILERLTKGKSQTEMTTGFLMLQAVDEDGWQAEWLMFCSQYYPNLHFDSTELRVMQSRTWQYLLFSEFVLDLPESTRLPASLKAIPTAPATIKEQITEVCRRLRDSTMTRDEYVVHAEKISRGLGLEKAFSEAKDLGKIVTFAFENQVEYAKYLAYINEGKYDEAARLLDENEKSVWYYNSDRVKSFWQLARQLNTLIHYAFVDKQGYGSTLDTLIDYYAKKGYHVDQAFRLFKTLDERVGFPSKYIKEMRHKAVSVYKDLTLKMVHDYQQMFAGGVLTVSVDRNCNAFSKYVLPELKSGKRVAMVMADAFRYEMAMQFMDKLRQSPELKVSCRPSLAQLPTYTLNGMAALLPDAGEKLRLQSINGKLIPTMDGKAINNPSDRVEYIKSHIPYKVQDIPLTDFETEKVDSDTHLLILRNTDIDRLGEHADIQALSSINDKINTYNLVILKCQAAGIDKVVVFADHGFMLNPDPSVSETVQKPKGSDIVMDSRRCVAGNLNSAPDTISFTSEQLGIDADVPRFVFAKNFCTFSKGHKYFHEGLSLEEDIVPEMLVTLKKDMPQTGYSLNISYHKDKITTLRPRFVFSVDFLNQMSEETLHLRIIVKDSKGRNVGHPYGSEYYDEDSEMLNVPGKVISFNLYVELDEDLTGGVTISVVEAMTQRLVTSKEFAIDFSNFR